MAATSFTYLALGDSYTLGEGVETRDSFPFQLVRILNETVNKTDNPAEHNSGSSNENNPRLTDHNNFDLRREKDPIKAGEGNSNENNPRLPDHNNFDLNRENDPIIAGEGNSELTRKNNHGNPGDDNPALFEEPVIIAKTGWTTSELIKAINDSDLKTNFDIVTLLIGVNNQYRGLALDEYGLEFWQLASVALTFAGNNPSRVFVLSIPDWSATPFAADLDREMISFTIDRFNELNRHISLRQGFHYIDITKGSRDVLNDSSLVTKDHLHPSAIEYRKWSDQLVPLISQQLSIKKIDQTST